MTRLHTLYERYGQSPWIDNIRRDWLEDGTLERLVEQGVRGVTSNPSIFAKAFATSNAYDEYLRQSTTRDPETLFESLAVLDVRDACDVLAVLHKESFDDFSSGVRRYLDGYVSLEVSPRLARDTNGTIGAAIRLNAEVARENVMIKIPATYEGLDAISTSLGEGINVNVTLIFSISRYEAVLNAWMTGLENALRQGRDLAQIGSVASFFVSRVDSAVDALLDEHDIRRGTTANAQVCAAYELYVETMKSPRARALLARGAQVQRPLWASTSTKNPAYPDLLYVNSIVGDETINTMPDATVAAVLDHGDFESSLLSDASTTRSFAKKLEELPSDVSLDAVTTRLETEGVQSFESSYEDLLQTVSKKMQAS